MRISVQVTADGELRRLSIEEQLAANEDEAQWSRVDDEGNEREEEGGSNQTIVDNNSAQVQWFVDRSIDRLVDASFAPPLTEFCLVIHRRSPRRRSRP